MTAYRYQAVAGASTFGLAVGFKRARWVVIDLRLNGYERVEIERSLKLETGGTRYWRWRNGKWSLHNHYDPKPADLERWR